jgi:hypothetical protein
MDPSVELGAGLHGNPTGLHGVRWALCLSTAARTTSWQPRR